MNILVRPPTEIELALSAHPRHVAFHQKIAAKAAALTAPKPPALAPVVFPVMPEAMPAETDPPVPFSERRWFWPADTQTFPEVRKIQECVSKYWGVTRADLMSGRRMKEQTRPRHIAIYLAKELTPLSLPAIGRRFGGRDHTTILYAYRKIEALALRDPETAHDVAVLVDALTGGKGA